MSGVHVPARPPRGGDAATGILCDLPAMVEPLLPVAGGPVAELEDGPAPVLPTPGVPVPVVLLDPGVCSPVPPAVLLPAITCIHAHHPEHYDKVGNTSYRHPHLQQLGLALCKT